MKRVIFAVTQPYFRVKKEPRCGCGGTANPFARLGSAGNVQRIKARIARFLGIPSGVFSLIVVMGEFVGVIEKGKRMKHHGKKEQRDA